MSGDAVVSALLVAAVVAAAVAGLSVVVSVPWLVRWGVRLLRSGDSSFTWVGIDMWARILSGKPDPKPEYESYRRVVRPLVMAFAAGWVLFAAFLGLAVLVSIA